MKKVENKDQLQEKSEQKSEPQDPSKIKESGFKVKGPEPTRYGDWERKGRVTDF